MEELVNLELIQVSKDYHKADQHLIQVLKEDKAWRLLKATIFKDRHKKQ